MSTIYIPETAIARSQAVGWAKRGLDAGGADGGNAGEDAPAPTTAV